MKSVVCWVGLFAIFSAGCKKQPVSIIASLTGAYTWSGVDSATVILDTNIHFGTTVSVIADTSFSIQVLNDSQVIVAILTPIYKFDGEVLYNELSLVETNTAQMTMTFYAPASIGYNFYCTTPSGNIAARTEYLTYNYGNHSLTYDCYLVDDANEHWELHLHSSGK